jgi:hypothetical protein
MLISKKLGQWTYHAHGKDIHEVRIKRGKDEGELRIINIYNPVSSIDTILKLEDVFGRKTGSCIVLGDFNLYYPA